jgi:hypothetical protein
LSSLYREILGAAWLTLPQQIRDMHEVTGRQCAEGRASVDRGALLISRCVGRVIGFPPETRDTPIKVLFDVSPNGELWTREFGASRFSSRQFRSDDLLAERFGLLSFAMALVATPDRLTLVLRRWSVLGVRLPMWLGPRATAYESVENGRFHFHVEISHPLTGLLVRYRGWLGAPRPSAASYQTDSMHALPR